MQRIKESFSLGMGEWEEWNTADEDDNFQLQPLGVSCEASMVLQPLGVSCEASMVLQPLGVSCEATMVC